MAHKSRAMIACWLFVFCIACSTQPTNKSNSYQGTGVVKSINLKAPAIEIDHGDIDGLMPAMQMEFPVTDAKLLNGIAVNDRIDFTIENNAGVLRVTAIKKK